MFVFQVAFYLKVPIHLDEFQEKTRKYGRFSRAGIGAGVVMKKMWAKLACAEIITTPVFSRFERALAALKKRDTGLLPIFLPSNL